MADVGKVIDDPEEPAQPLSSTVENDVSKQADYDFVEQPSEDFFCPVTFELLLDPHQTMCCGNHLSLSTVTRLQHDGKPCPMCKEPKLATMPDKFFGRTVSGRVIVHCPNKAGGCEWKGEVGGVKQHEEACPKHPWKCRYCDYASTLDAEMDHVMNCTHYPTTCPNQCDVGTIPQCQIEEHLATCLLEVVPCEFSDTGCNVKTTRLDLKRHMDEFQQQHLLSATILNLKLTKETIAEKDRQLIEKDRQLAEKGKQLADKDSQLVEKDKIIAKKDEEVSSKDTQISILQKELKSLWISLAQVGVGVDRLLGGMKNCQLFTVERVVLQNHWVSKPFYSHRSGFKLRLYLKNLSPLPRLRQGGYLERTMFATVTRVLDSGVTVGLVLYKGEYDCEQNWPVTFCVELQMLDQLKGKKHLQESYEFLFLKACDHHDGVPSEQKRFTARSTLHPDGETSPYVVNDSIKLRLWIHLK